MFRCLRWFRCETIYRYFDINNFYSIQASIFIIFNYSILSSTSIIRYFRYCRSFNTYYILSSSTQAYLMDSSYKIYLCINNKISNTTMLYFEYLFNIMFFYLNWFDLLTTKLIVLCALVLNRIFNQWLYYLRN